MKRLGLLIVFVFLCSLRGSDGTLHEFQASAETLKNLKVGGRVEAQLRAAPGC